MDNSILAEIFDRSFDALETGKPLHRWISLSHTGVSKAISRFKDLTGKEWTIELTFHPPRVAKKVKWAKDGMGEIGSSRISLPYEAVLAIKSDDKVVMDRGDGKFTTPISIHIIGIALAASLDFAEKIHPSYIEIHSPTKTEERFVKALIRWAALKSGGKLKKDKRFIEGGRVKRIRKSTGETWVLGPFQIPAQDYPNKPSKTDPDGVITKIQIEPKSTSPIELFRRIRQRSEVPVRDFGVVKNTKKRKKR